MVREILVHLTVASEERSGAAHPVFVRLGAKKFLLTSEIDFLLDDSTEQVFRIPPAELARAQVRRSDLDSLGIGVLGSDRRFADVADRVKLQRVIVQADKEVVYDSEMHEKDRSSLAAIWLVPPAHRDQDGRIVLNPESNRLRHLWTPGIALDDSDNAPI